MKYTDLAVGDAAPGVPKNCRTKKLSSQRDTARRDDSFFGTWSGQCHSAVPLLPMDLRA